jgi:CBS domain-containing protein
VLPGVLAAAAAAYAVTVLLMKRSILTEKIARRGQHITREYGVDPYELARVSEVMAREVVSIGADLSIRRAAAAMQAGGHRAYPLVDAQGRPVGMASLADVLAWKADGVDPEETLRDRLSDASTPVVHPNDVVGRAVDVMVSTGAGRLPVTDPASGRLVGIVSRRDVLQVRERQQRAESEREAYLRPRALPA